MTWGSFSNIHLLTLAIAVLVNVLIYLILKRNTRAKQILALFVLSLIGVAFVLYTMLADKDNIIRNLPLHFWALNMLILPFAVLTREKSICNLLLIWSAGSVVSLVFNTAMANVELLSFEFLIYFTMHMFGAGIPILLFELGLVKRDTKTVQSTIGLSVIAYVLVHCANLLINSANGWTVSDGVNYMSTLEPTSSLLSFFYAIMPAPFWYMLLALPVLCLYVLYWYLPEILDERRRRRPLRTKLKDIDRYYEEYEEKYIEEILDKKYRSR